MADLSFGKYVTTQLLGRGGMAEVYRARHPALGRDVAIKVIYPHLATDPGFEDRFRQEAQLVASLRHAHIVQLYDYDVINNQPFMVMEYLGGGTLKDRLEQWRARGQAMPLGEIAALLDDIGGALDYAHARGAIHRDVKPANVMFTESGEPVLTDFGIAKILSGATQLSASGSVMGTPAYMSPEQATSKPVDARSDIYSLGVVLYEMATGHVPFQGESPTAVMVQHLNTPPPPPREFNPNLPDSVQAVILKAIAKNPADRFAGAGELARAFRAALVGKAPEAAAEVSLEALTEREKPVASAQRSDRPPAVPDQPTTALPAWLGHLAGIAEIFAPLLGRQAPQVKQPPQDRRSLIATILGILGIILATLQFLIQFFDLFARAAAPIVGVLPYLVAPLIVVGAVLLLYASARAATPLNRRRARAVFLLTSVVGIAWGLWTILDRATPPSGLIVLVADFERKGTLQADIAGTISRELNQEVSDSGGAVTVVQAHETYTSQPEARDRGAARKATIVIWGSYDDLSVNPSVETLQAPTVQHEAISIPLLLQTASAATIGGGVAPRQPQVTDMVRFVRVPAVLPNLQLFAQNNTTQIIYVSTAILAVSLYANGDSTRALSLFDKALANAATSGGQVKGLEDVYFERAAVLYGMGKVSDSAADLEKALAIKPDLYEAHHNLALAYSETCGTGSPLDNAIGEAQTASRLRPNDVTAHQLLGDLYRQASKYDQAVAEFQTALQFDSNNPDTYNLLAAAWNAMGRTSDAQGAGQMAISLYQKVPSQSADSFNAHLGLGDAYLAAGDYDRALTEYQAAQKLEPDKLSVHHGLGDAYYRKNQFDLAEQEYKQMATLGPKDPAPHILLGLLYDQQKKSPEAISEWKQAADLNQCDPSPHLLLGGHYWEQKDYKNAAGEFQAAVSINPHDADALYLLGVNQYFLNQLDDAVKSLQASITQRSDYAGAHYALGETYSAMKKYDQAASEWEQASKLSPNEPSYLIALGDAYEKLSRPDDAVAAYQKALALKDDANTHLYLGLVLQKKNKLDLALAEFQKAVALDATNALAFSALGNVLSIKGRLDEAVSAYRQAISLNDSAAAHLQLASLLLGQGKTGDATAEYQKALALDPANSLAHVGLGNLYLNAGKLDDAAKEYQAALSAKSDSVEAHYGLAQVEYKRCNLSTATQEQSAAAASAKTNQSFYQGSLATYLEAQGRTDDAAKIYSSLQNDPPNDFSAHYYAGYYLYRTGKQDAAAREYQLALQDPNLNPVLGSLGHNALGQVYYSQDKLVAAQTEFQSALKLSPINAEPLLWLGDIALRAKDTAGAQADYDQAVVLLPAYGQSYSADSAALINVGLQLRRGLVLTRQGKSSDAKAAFDQAQSLAGALVQVTAQWPLAHFAAGLVYEIQGDKAHSEAEFAAATQCDQSLIAARAQSELFLAKLR